MGAHYAPHMHQLDLRMKDQYPAQEAQEEEQPVRRFESEPQII